MNESLNTPKTDGPELSAVLPGPSRCETVLVRSYPASGMLHESPVNLREVRRYAGVPASAPADPALEETLDEVLSCLLPALQYKAVGLCLPLSWDGEKALLPLSADSLQLSRCLHGSTHVVFFAATVGPSPDRLIRTFSHTSSLKALLVQAAGAERVEALCDRYCEDIRLSLASSGLSITPRFSPGYGDLPLSVQRDLFRLLDPARRVGISLGENLLMSPSKSVTAIFGIRPL